MDSKLGWDEAKILAKIVFLTLSNATFCFCFVQITSTSLLPTDFMSTDIDFIHESACLSQPDLKTYHTLGFTDSFLKMFSNKSLLNVKNEQMRTHQNDSLPNL